MVLRDPSASASRASRDFHRFFAEEWTQAARFGADAYPATPVTVLRRPDGWEPDSARVAEVEERLGALAAVRDTSTALTEWILRAGEALRGSGRLDGAGVLLAAALERRPDDAEILFEVGLTHLLKQEWDEAMYAMFDALRIDPHHGPAQYNLGTLLEREGDLNGAETAYRAAILYLDDPAPAHGRLGALLAKRGELNEARAELEIVQRIDPLGEDARLLKRAIAEAERSDP
jgi:tetratricopeptide (TPR) repeat protein